MARVRGALLLLALARPSVHATRCDETSCDSYCDPLQAAHCSFCSCRTCHHCLHSPGTKGPQRAGAEAGESKGGTERGPALSDDERRSDVSHRAAMLKAFKEAGIGHTTSQAAALFMAGFRASLGLPYRLCQAS